MKGYFRLLILVLMLSSLLVSCYPTDDFSEDIYTKGSIYSWNGTAWVDLTNYATGNLSSVDATTPTSLTGLLIGDSGFCNSVTLPDGDIVGTTESQYLYNKTIHGGSESILMITTGSARGFQVECVNDDVYGGKIDIHHSSSTPADNDWNGFFRFRGQNSNNEDTVYAYLIFQSADVTDGTEDGRFRIWLREDGATNEVLVLDSDGTLYTYGDLDLGGNVIIPGYPNYFDVDSGYLRLKGTSYPQLSLETSYGGVWGAEMRTYSMSSSPADNDIPFRYVVYGKNDNNENTNYGDLRIVSTDVSDGTEDGKCSFWLMEDGALNEAMYITGVGDLWVDADYHTFDIYSDTELVIDGFKAKDFKKLESVGLAELNTNKEYMINLVGITSLLAGMLDEKDKEIKALEARIDNIERELSIVK